MAIYSRASLRQLVSGCIVAALTFCMSGAQAQGAALEPMITFDQSHPMLADNHDIPMVRVYADGRVIVSRGPGMRKPGLYEFILSDAEFAEITQLAKSTDIVNFSAADIASAKQSDAELIAVSESSTSFFEFNRLQGGVGLVASASETATSEVQSIQVDDVVATASAIPNARSVQPLKALHVKMIELFSRAGN